MVAAIIFTDCPHSAPIVYGQASEPSRVPQVQHTLDIDAIPIMPIMHQSKEIASWIRAMQEYNSSTFLKLFILITSTALTDGNSCRYMVSRHESLPVLMQRIAPRARKSTSQDQQEWNQTHLRESRHATDSRDCSFSSAERKHENRGSKLFFFSPTSYRSSFTQLNRSCTYFIS